MEAVLHIGVAKTGTTTIQHFCHANRDRLLQQGFLYTLCMITPIPAFKDHNLLCSQGIAGLKDRGNFFPERQTLFPAQDVEHYQENYELHYMSRECWDAMATFIVDLAAHKLDADRQMRQLRADLKRARQLIKRLRSPGQGGTARPGQP